MDHLAEIRRIAAFLKYRIMEELLEACQGTDDRYCGSTATDMGVSMHIWYLVHRHRTDTPLLCSCELRTVVVNY